MFPGSSRFHIFLAVMTVLMSEDPQQIRVTHCDETLKGLLVLGSGETVGENSQTEAELGQTVKREVTDGETSI